MFFLCALPLGKMRIAYKILDRKPDSRELFQLLGIEGIIYVECDYEDRIQLAQDIWQFRGAQRVAHSTPFFLRHQWEKFVFCIYVYYKNYTMIYVIWYPIYCASARADREPVYSNGYCPQFNNVVHPCRSCNNSGITCVRYVTALSVSKPLNRLMGAL